MHRVGVSVWIYILQHWIHLPGVLYGSLSCWLRVGGKHHPCLLHADFLLFDSCDDQISLVRLLGHYHRHHDGTSCVESDGVLCDLPRDGWVWNESDDGGDDDGDDSGVCPCPCRCPYRLPDVCDHSYGCGCDYCQSYHASPFPFPFPCGEKRNHQLPLRAAPSPLQAPFQSRQGPLS